MLQSHGDVCHGVPEHGESKYGPPPKPVRNGAKEYRPCKKAGEGCGGESGLVRKTEQSLSGGSKNPTGNKAWAHVGSLKQIVHFKEGAEREKHDQTPDRPAGRQPVNACRDFRWIISSHILPPLKRWHVSRNRSRSWLLENSWAAFRQLLFRQFDIQVAQISGRQGGELLHNIKKSLGFLRRDNSLGECLKFVDVVRTPEWSGAKRVRICDGQGVFHTRSIFKQNLDPSTEGFSGRIGFMVAAGPLSVFPSFYAAPEPDC